MFLKSPKMLTRKSLCKIGRIVSIGIRNYTNSNILALTERGVIQGVFPDTAQSKVKDCLLEKPQHIYAGFDPTADSLHIGNLLVIMGLVHCQRAGHYPIALIGGATGQIGDPSGRTTERTALLTDTLNHNLSCIRSQIQRVFDNHEEHFWAAKSQSGSLKPVRIVNNADWYNKMSFIDFIGNMGRNFRMGDMLARSSVKSRLDSSSGMSFTEFTYQILQAYDWLHLYQTHGCRFQLGGNDQLGNMYSGHELITRVKQKDVFALTLPIITNDQGSKFGKSAGNAVWIDAEKTSPFTLYQFFARMADSEVEKLLKLFTFLELSEIEEIVKEHQKKPELREGQTRLAEEVTLLLHGTKGLERAKLTTKVLYKGNLEALSKLSGSEIRGTFVGAEICDILLEPGMTVLDLVMKAKCFAKDKDAIRIIAAGGFSINQARCQNISEIISPTVHILPNDHTLLRVGKKNFYIINWLK